MIPEIHSPNKIFPVRILDRTYAVGQGLGKWVEIPNGTTVDELRSHWVDTSTKPEPKDDSPTKFPVLSSDGKKTYFVIERMGVFYCDCVGYGFKRTCRHIKEIQTKYFPKKITVFNR